MKNTRTALRQIRVGMVTLTRTFTENSFESDMLILDMLSIWGVEGDCLRESMFPRLAQLSWVQKSLLFQPLSMASITGMYAPAHSSRPSQTLQVTCHSSGYTAQLKQSATLDMQLGVPAPV